MLSEQDILNNKQLYLEKLNNLVSLSMPTKESIIKFLESSDFFIAPASTIYHANYKGGLCEHSLNVARELELLTQKLNLTWKEEDSPVLIGLLHDICKTNLYQEYEKNVKQDNNWVQKSAFILNDTNPALGLHGDRSVMMLLMLRRNTKDFSIEQLSCIRFHMGSYMQQDASKFQEAIRQNINVYWTHVADNVASIKELVIK